MNRFVLISLFSLFILFIPGCGNTPDSQPIETSPIATQATTPPVATPTTSSSDAMTTTSSPVATPTTPSSSLEQVERTPITLAVYEYDLSCYQPLINLFEREHPDIQVRLVGHTEAPNADQENSIRAWATSFDVFPYASNRADGTQYLLDLRPLLIADAQFDTADFLPGLLPDAPAPLWSIPIGAAYYITYYDKTAFDAADLAYPQLEWNVDDFLAAAQALTMREDGEVTRWGYVPGQLRYSPLLVTQLTSPLDTGDGLRLTDPDVVAAAQWMSDLFTVHEVSPWLEYYKPDDRHTGSNFQTPFTLTNIGQAAMWHSTHILYDATREHVGVTAVPHSQHGYAADPLLTGFAVSRGTRSPEAAWQLLHFLSRQPLRTCVAWATEYVPARRSVAAAENYWEQLPAELAPVLQYAAENNVAPRISYPVATLLPEAFAAHIDDNIPVAAALELGMTAVPPPVATEEIVVAPEAEPTVDNNATHITFMTLSYLSEQHQLLAEAFQREYPNIVVHVEMDDTPGINLLERLSNADCFVESASVLHDDELRAAILSLDPFLDIDGSIQTDDFYPLQRNYFIAEGQLMAIPAFMVTRLIEYNRDLFSEAGVPEPPLDWTLDDFLEIAQQMTWGEGAEKHYGYAEPSVILGADGINAFDIQFIDASSGVPTFNYAAAAEMISWYADLTRVYEIRPPLTGDFAADFLQITTLLEEGRVAMWNGALSDVVIGTQNRPLPFDIGFAPIPVGPSGSRGDLTDDANGYYIMADSAQREACWQWIKFLTLHPQAISLKQSLPAHIETAESTEYIDHVGEGLAAAARAFMDSSNPRPYIEEPSWFFPGHDWLRAASREVASGESDVATALANADVKFSQYRQCIIEQEAFNNEGGQLDCLASVDPTLASQYTFRP